MKEYSIDIFLPPVARAWPKEWHLSASPRSILSTRQIVEGRGGVWVIGAEGFLVDLERALIERFGFGVIAHGMIQHRQIVEGRAVSG